MSQVSVIFHVIVMFDVTKALGVTGVTLYFMLAVTLDVTKALSVTVSVTLDVR